MIKRLVRRIVMWALDIDVEVSGNWVVIRMWGAEIYHSVSWPPGEWQGPNNNTEK